MQINSSDPNSIGFGDSGIDSPGEYGKGSPELEDNQQQFASFLRSENEDFDPEVDEYGGGDDELLELEADDDSVLDLKLSDEITEESDKEIQEDHDSTKAETKDAQEDRAELQEKRSDNIEESRDQAAEELDRENDMEDAELLDLDDLQIGIDADDFEMGMSELDQEAPSDEVESFSQREGRSAGYEDAVELQAELQESYQIADDEQDRIDAAEGEDAADLSDDIQGSFEGDAVQMESEFEEIQPDQMPELSGESTNKDKQGRSAGYVEALGYAEAVQEGDDASSPEPAVRSMESVTEVKMESAQEESYQIADDEQDRLDMAEGEDAADLSDDIQGSYDGDPVPRDIEIEQSEQQPQEMPKLSGEASSSDKQGRSAGFAEALGYAEAVAKGSGVEMPDADDEAGSMLQASESVSEMKMEAEEEESYQLADDEQDRIDAAEGEDAADLSDDVQLSGEEVERFDPQSFSLDAESDEEHAQSTSVGGDPKGGSSQLPGEGGLTPLKLAEKDSTDGSVEKMEKFDLEEKQERRLEQDDEIDSEQDESSEGYTQWMEDVHRDIQEGEQLNIAMEELFDGTMEERSLTETGEESARAEESADAMSDNSRDDRQGTRVSTTVGDAILSTMVSGSLSSQMDQRTVIPEFYRMINSIEASYYQHGMDSLAVGEQDAGGQSSVEDSKSFSVGQFSGGVEIELKDDKYAHLGGTKVNFKMEDGVLTVNFKNDSLHAQELLQEQGQMLIKELSDRFPGGIKVSLNDELIGELKTPEEGKQVATTVLWDSPKPQDSGDISESEESEENDSEMDSEPRSGEKVKKAGTSMNMGSGSSG